MEKRNQHYIPQFYLNYFTDLDVPPMHNPYVWMYDRVSEAIKNKSPKNIAYEKGYNDIINEEGKIDATLEDQFQKIETETAKVFRKLIKFEYISKNDRLQMCKFVLSMRTRIPYYKDMYVDIVQNGDQTAIPLDVVDVTKLPSQFPMNSVIFAANNVSHLLLRMDWSLLIAPNEINFITSDNPVVVKDPEDLSYRSCGFSSSPNVQVTFPLTPKICLFGSWGRYRRLIEYIDTKEVKEINFETFKYSYQYLYSSTRDIAKEILMVNHLVNIGKIY